MLRDKIWSFNHLWTLITDSLMPSTFQVMLQRSPIYFWNLTKLICKISCSCTAVSGPPYGNLSVQWFWIYFFFSDYFEKLELSEANCDAKHVYIQGMCQNSFCIHGYGCAKMTILLLVYKITRNYVHIFNFNKFIAIVY